MLNRMTSHLDNGSKSAGDRARARAYNRDFWPGMVAYGIVLTAVPIWGNLDGRSSWRYLWTLPPVVPAVWIVRAVVRHFSRIDDYQRLLQLQGLAVGFAVAMMASLTVGFLGIAGLQLSAHGLAGWIVYTAGMTGWAATVAVLSAK